MTNTNCPKLRVFCDYFENKAETKKYMGETLIPKMSSVDSELLDRCKLCCEEIKLPAKFWASVFIRLTQYLYKMAIYDVTVGKCDAETLERDRSDIKIEMQL